MDQLRTPNEPRLSLYPEIVPHRTGKLRVSPLHEIYFEECGSPTGKPAVLLHGGPGGGINPVMRRYHDPSAYRIVLFDQRGCGRSTPHASLEENTTWHLVDDIERLREHLGIESWQVFGGSWGSTLALAYAETYPERVTELVLRGIFTLRQQRARMVLPGGLQLGLPRRVRGLSPADPARGARRHDRRLLPRLTDPDPDIQIEAARAWSAWEGSTLSLIPDSDRVRRFSEEHYALAFARIECHYFINEGFFNADDQLIRDAGPAFRHSRRDRAWPLRRGDAGQDRLRPRPRLA